MLKIVTHYNPDLDAITSVWLLKRFSKDFSNAEVVFVAAGNTYNNQTADSNMDIVHVDTGMGKFDHHQRQEKTCASSLVFNYLKSKNNLENNNALIRLIEVVRDIDNFGECLWPNPTADYFDFNLPELLNGMKIAGELNDEGLIEEGMKLLDGVYVGLKIKIKAEKELAQGIIFDTKWGKAIGCLSHNDLVLKLGQKMGYVLVVQKDGQTEHVRIKARPDSRVDLTEIREKLANLDPNATWFLHVSKRMLLNGSSRNPNMKPSQLSLKKVIEIIQL